MAPWPLGLREPLGEVGARPVGRAALCPPETWSLGPSQGA